MSVWLPSVHFFIEIEKFFPNISVFQEACPMWVPLIENNELNNEGTRYFVKKHIDQLFAQSSKIDTIILGCTHYPLLKSMIEEYVPENVKILTQGQIVSNSLRNYLNRHSEIESKISKNADVKFFTTDSVEQFNQHASMFFGKDVSSQHLSL